MFKAYFDKYSDEFIHTVKELDFAKVEVIAKLLEQARAEGKQIFVLGNGGSGASASHWVCDFAKGVNVDGIKRFRMFSLTDNVPLLSAIGNDIDYEDIFVEPLKNYLQSGDLVIGLSVSGNSENIVRAFQYARSREVRVAAIIGQKEGRMKALADTALVIPSGNYGIVEDIHMFINHVISQYFYEEYKNMAKKKIEITNKGD